MLKKAFFILAILGGCLFYWPQIVLAQSGGVNMSARVLEKKATDTINDFTVDGQDYSRAPLKAILGASTDIPSTQSESPHISNQFRWQYLLFLSPIYMSYYLITNILLLPNS